MNLQSLSHRLQKFFRLPIYGNKTLKIAFEFGLVLLETAKGMDIKITPEIAIKAEEIIIRELKENGLNKTAINFLPLIMTMLEEGTIEEEK